MVTYLINIYNKPILFLENGKELVYNRSFDSILLFVFFMFPLKIVCLCGVFRRK